MFERTIVVTAEDQAIVQRLLGAGSNRRPLLITAAVVVPTALAIAVAMSLTGDPLAFVLLGAVAALTLLFVALLVVRRVVIARTVRTGMPLGSSVTARIDAEGFRLTGANGETRLPWRSIAGLRRRGAGVIVLGPANRPAVLLPGRIIDDAAIAAIPGWAANSAE